MLRFLLFLFWLFSLENKQSSSHDVAVSWVAGWYGMVLIEKDGERWLVMVALVWVVMRVVSEKESFVSPIEARNKQCAIGK